MRIVDLLGGASSAAPSPMHKVIYKVIYRVTL
jgi:hypothetical protein